MSWEWDSGAKCWRRIVGRALLLIAAGRDGAGYRWLVTARGSGAVYAEGRTAGLGAAKSAAGAAGRRLSARG